MIDWALFNNMYFLMGGIAIFVVSVVLTKIFKQKNTFKVQKNEILENKQTSETIIRNTDEHSDKYLMYAEGNFIIQNIGGRSIMNIKMPEKPDLVLQYPPQVENFINREKELTKLLNDLKPGTVITLCGAAGIGKSALASKAVWKLAPKNKPPSRFPNGIFWYDFYSNSNIENILEDIAISFGEEPRPTPELAAKRALSNKSLLVILEGTENANDLPFLLNILGACCILITTQKKSDAVGKRDDLKLLPTDEAVKLFLSCCKIDDIESVKKICELTGGLPLAVCLAGRYISIHNKSVKEYLNDLENTALDALSHGGGDFESVPLLLKRSFKQISDDAINVFSIIGVLAFDSFSREVIKAVIPDKNIKNQIYELVGYGLLNRIDDDRFMISHSLIYTYAKNNYIPDNNTIERIAAFFNSYVKEYGDQDSKRYNLIDKEKKHISYIIEECKTRCIWKSISDLTWSIQDYYFKRGYWTDLVMVLELAIESAQNLKDKESENLFLGHLAIVYFCLGQIEKSIELNKKSLLYIKENGIFQNEAPIINNMGNAYKDLGQVKKALRCYEQALKISIDIEDRKGEEIALGNIGLAYKNLGQLNEAIDYSKQALIVSREIGHIEGESVHLGNLGNAYQYLGQVKKALKYYGQALVISRKIGDRVNESIYLRSHGLVLSDTGKMQEAINYYKQSLKISEDIVFQKNKSACLGDIGSALYLLGHTEDAIIHYKKALHINIEIKHRQGEATNLMNLANVYTGLGNINKAIEFYEQALIVYRDISDKQNETTLLCNLGETFRNLGQIDKSIDYFEQALVISKKIGFKKGESFQLNNLGLNYYSLGQIEKAIEYQKQALDISQKIGYKQVENSTLGNLGLALHSLNQTETAIKFLEKALIISREIGDRKSEANHLGNLGIVMRDLGQVEEAINYFKQTLVIKKETRDRQGEGICLGNLANAYNYIGNFEIAINYAEQGLYIALEILDPLSEAFRLWEIGSSYKGLKQKEKSKQYLKKSLNILERVKSPYADILRNILIEY